MGISNKLDLFIILLLIIPIFIQLIKPLNRKLKFCAESGHFSGMNATLGAGLIFVHDFSNFYMSMILLTLGFILFFCTYAVALAALSELTFKSEK